MKDASVLIVEDAPEVRMVLTEFLKIIGVRETYECKDGLEALAILNRQLEGDSIIPDIHIMLCDIHMPRMDGISLLREIKKNERLRNLGVIMLSGDGTEEMILDSIQSGADAFIVKPCSLNTIEEKIITFLKKRRIQ